MKKLNNTKKRELRNRKKLKTVSNRYRVSVFKSLKNISAQIIDDKEKKTLVSASSIEKEVKANKKKKEWNFYFVRRNTSKKSNSKKNYKSLFWSWSIQISWSYKDVRRCSKKEWIGVLNGWMAKKS